MIPKNITKGNILEAIKYIDRFGVPSKRDSTKYDLKYKGKNYPPKYVISIANKCANGEELESTKFSGGRMTNKFLCCLGFDIYEDQVKL